MTWIRIDDSFFTHPKIAGLTTEAICLHMAGLCYSSQHLTDGYISTQVLPILLRRNAIRALNLLTSRGLWHKDGTEGYRIHDYLDYQTSKAQVEKIKETTRKRVEKFRSAKSEEKVGNADVTALQKVGNGHVTHSEPPTEPPTEPYKEKNFVQTSFERFWEIYPRRDGKKKAQEAFEKALKKTDIKTILEGVTRYIAFLKTTTQQTAMPATWLNGERWNDEVSPIANIPKNVPHHRLEDPTGPYCGSCHQTWPCNTESKKGGNPF